MNLKLSSSVMKASLVYLTFVSLWTTICCTEPALDTEASLREGQPSGFKRAAFSAWAGKRNSDKSSYFPENDKRAAFSSWAGKRDSSWTGNPTDDDDVIGNVYSAEEPAVVSGEDDVTTDDKRAPFSSWAGKRAAFSSWAGKRAAFSSWAGKRTPEVRNQLELINHLLEQIVARVMRKRMFNAWAGKRAPDDVDNLVHDVTRRKFSAWHGK